MTGMAPGCAAPTPPTDGGRPAAQTTGGRQPDGVAVLGPSAVLSVGGDRAGVRGFAEQLRSGNGRAPLYRIRWKRIAAYADRHQPERLRAFARCRCTQRGIAHRDSRILADELGGERSRRCLLPYTFATGAAEPAAPYGDIGLSQPELVHPGGGRLRELVIGWRGRRSRDHYAVAAARQSDRHRDSHDGSAAPSGARHSSAPMMAMAATRAGEAGRRLCRLWALGLGLRAVNSPPATAGGRYRHRSEVEVGVDVMSETSSRLRHNSV